MPTMTDETRAEAATEGAEETAEAGQRPENEAGGAGGGGGAEAVAGTEGAEGAEGAEKTPGELLPLDFTTFILSLSTSVLMNLGVVENPVTKKTEKELPVAKQTIDLLTLLKEKTQGNLTEDETGLLDNVLHELRMLYVKAAG
ncbi:MAG: DUF1844 domain-containing protein [Thermodesulfobacteriota bacterium]